ncbi:MAG: hypothetical protein JWN94_315 [Betaproteobacteria bacterium]|nr:hypothetical protein [Betaproteobacteria bacterium]
MLLQSSCHWQNRVILTNLIARLFARPPIAADELLQRGYRYQQAGDPNNAESTYRSALKNDSRSADAHYLLGALLGEQGRLVDAADHLDRALALNPASAEAHAARGNVFLMREDKAAAQASYQRALDLNPANSVAHCNLGLLLQAAGSNESAFHHFKRAYELAPDIPDLLKNLTLSHLHFERYEEAQELLERILQNTPLHFEALKCLGLVLQKTHRPDEALRYYELALKIGADEEFLNNFGIVLQDLGRLDEAIEKYGEAIALKPDYPLAIWHRSLAYLLQHDFARGWPDYELRGLNADRSQRPTAFPRWDGDALAGKTLLIYAEQGLGDEIMFSSCVPDVIAAGADVIIESSPKLETLFQRSFPAAKVYSMTGDRSLPAEILERGINLQIPIGSLPLHFRRTSADFPPHRGYLQVDGGRVARWRERLDQLGSGLKVGISWQGGTHRSRRPVRSIPLAGWQPILQAKSTHFIDLQYVDFGPQLDDLHLKTGIRVHSWEEIRTDYEEAAALVTAVDLVISVCTAVIHLGGALGKPVWVMAPYSPEWRYGSSSAGMPWYPSVRVFRQPEYGHWDAVIAQVASSLEQVRAGERAL